MCRKLSLCLILFCLILGEAVAQHSVARQWNEQLLESIRNDFARPTVHARNLFHISAAMYDAWAAYEPTADTYFLGKTHNGYTFDYKSISASNFDRLSSQETAISYAAYRLIVHRFEKAPFKTIIRLEAEDLMTALGYDIDLVSTDYTCGPAQLGNYIAEQIIAFGLLDGSNEQNDYSNIFYEPINPPMRIEGIGNPFMVDINRWQPISFEVFIDQAGNPIGDNTPEFLSPEWGNVHPFSLSDADAQIFQRDGDNYKVYHDPGPPVKIEDQEVFGLDNYFKWGHMMVAVWSSHLDPADTTRWDISPASLGNIQSYPETPADYENFYNFLEGGDAGTGYAQNPFTGQAYEPNIVKRSDYARVLAEFWADGPDSETPPGHWFTILNTVNDDPNLEKRFQGEGPILSDLEWDVKSYFILGGAMHDVAISVWGIKGWYDYVRPVSALRAMATLGQCVDPALPNYNIYGLPVLEDYSELILPGDSLEGDFGQDQYRVKFNAWRGPDFIEDPATSVAGVSWIRATQWWPYQRPTFVTPPFAGYVSGHSTFSRAAAEVLTAITGDPYFPGGMGVFECPKEEFLVFEDGPSETVNLQWATYRDASDQCSLSRIWGGIHPPVDDIPGRLIGEKIGKTAFEYAVPFFTKTSIVDPSRLANIFPNPSNCSIFIDYPVSGDYVVEVFHSDGRLLAEIPTTFFSERAYVNMNHLESGLKIIILRDADGEIIFQDKVITQR